MEKTAKIYVAGHRGLAGSALVKKLREERYGNLLLRAHTELDLTDQAAVRAFFDQDASKPDGTLRKVLDTSRLNALGWKPEMTLLEGIGLTYKEYLSLGKQLF